MLRKRFFGTRSLLRTLAVLTVFVLAFGLAGCDNGNGPTGGGTRDPVTYTGTASGVTYSLRIEDGGARAVLTPTQGDSYTLTASGKTSTGTVSAFVNSILTLTPSTQGVQPFFTVTVSGTSITAMTGSITWDNGTSENAPTTFNPVTPPGGGVPAGPGTGGNPVLANGEIWIDDAKPSQGHLFIDNNVYIYFLTAGTWGGRQKTGEWSGNTINTNGDVTGRPNGSTFTVSSNKLYEYSLPQNTHVATYTKTSGQTISGQSGGGGGGSFVGTWIGGQGNTGRFVIDADGTWSIGTEAPIVGFVSQYIGTYTVSGSTATFTGTAAYDPYPPIIGTNTATVSGNTLTLNAGGSLMTSFGQTWTRQQ